jgi:TRAP-type C4-dicarboxylate transport system permease small subunit
MKQIRIAASKMKWFFLLLIIIGSPFFGIFLAQNFFHGSEDLLMTMCFLISLVGGAFMIIRHAENTYKDQKYSKIDVDSSGVDAYPTFIDVGGFSDSSGSF